MNLLPYPKRQRVNSNRSGGNLAGNILLGYGGNVIVNRLANAFGTYMIGGVFLNGFIGNILGNITPGVG